MNRVLTFFLAILTLCASAAEPLGKKPAHVWGGPSGVVNDQAITRMIWAPGIDEGYVPQGLTWAEGALFLSTYRSTDTKVDKGPCRVFKLDPNSGATLAHLDLPEECGHAGGVAPLGKGAIVVADTRKLFRIDLEAFKEGAADASKAITSVVGLKGELKGSFADFDGTSLFIGTYERNAEKSKGHFLPVSIFEKSNGKTLNESAAVRIISLPVEAQGAAFDSAGALWITSSSSKFGALVKLDAKSGEVLARYDMVIGIEDLAFDDTGALWSVSEAGSLRWQKWGKTFPVVFRVDLAKLK